MTEERLNYLKSGSDIVVWRDGDEVHSRYSPGTPGYQYWRAQADEGVSRSIKALAEQALERDPQTNRLLARLQGKPV